MAKVSHEKLQSYILAKELIEFKKDGLPYWKVKGKGINTAKPAGCLDKSGYRRISIKGDLLLAHRVSWFICNNFNPDTHIDHMDGNKDNNRIENLRVCTPSQNQFNMKKSILNTTGYKGVQRDSGTGIKPFRARVRFKGNRYCLGRFATAEEAKNAYDKKAKELHEEFYRFG